MAGDPSLDISYHLFLEAASAGADFLEVGVPFSDPTADGPVIRLAAQRSLEEGTSLENVLKLTGSLKKETTVPLYLLSYFNPLCHFGLQQFFAEAAEQGAEGVIIPDLPLKERKRILPLADEKGVAIVPLLPPDLTGRCRLSLLQDARGFVYCITTAGVTGERNNFSSSFKKSLEEARQLTNLPLYAGFGVKNPEMACQAALMADGVIVGSNLVKEIPAASSQRDLLHRIRQKTHLYKKALKKL